MPLASTFLAAKALALSLLNLSARVTDNPAAPGGPAPAAIAGNEWSAVLDKSFDIYSNMSRSGREEAWRAIFPGTLWCGQGSKARSFDELGVFAGPDRCCRDHDHCPDFINRHESKHGLFNGHLSASALCACDHKFLQCLRADGSVIAREVGRLYFDFLEPVCFTYDYPVKRCLRRDKCSSSVGSAHRPSGSAGGEGQGRCVEYEYDTTRAPEWHFEDFPFHYASRSAAGEVSVAAEGAAALAGQERPDVAANGEDAELWNALLMNRHVRFGSKFSAAREAAAGPAVLGSVIGDQVFPGADGG
ncbi:Phospholipase A2 [Frankliniella fusca]|uniref:phospholipase A2 n=1 Tax=Frankliniella fusca TaxID=407009 RepID=A0AAE1HGS0_9NEOP|nr:Phospholipase A2 [Frankliniella fusca]